MDKETNPYTELAKSVEEMLSPDEVISKSLTTDDVKEEEKAPETEVPAENEDVKEPETEKEEEDTEADKVEEEETPETKEADVEVEEEAKPEDTEEEVEEDTTEEEVVEPEAETKEDSEEEEEPKAEVVVDAPVEKVEKSITLEAEPIKAVSPEFEKAMLSIVGQFATRMNSTLESVEEIKKSLEAIKAEKVETISKSMDEEEAVDLSEVEGKAQTVAVAPKESISKSLTDEVVEDVEELDAVAEPQEPTFDYEGLREQTNSTFLESITRMTQDDAEATRNYLRETLPTHGGAQAVSQDTINIIQEINKKYN